MLFLFYLSQFKKTNCKTHRNDYIYFFINNNSNTYNYYAKVRKRYPNTYSNIQIIKRQTSEFSHCPQGELKL